MSDAGLTPLEVASGLVFGVEPEDGSTPRVEAPLAALEAVVLPALRRPPCLVSFSGGRDSSCVLALAAEVARREGLPPPIPATLRFPEFPEADETAWQERVVSSLRLEEWIRIEPGEELDAVGAVATKVLRRFGLLWPFNTYVHAPLLEAARGGSLLTGIGGDEIFEHMTPDRVHSVLARRARPTARDVLRFGLAAAPWPVRRAVLRRRHPFLLPWLVPDASRQVSTMWATAFAREPRRLAARAGWWSRLRSLRVTARSLGLLASAEDVHVAHPLAEPALADGILRNPALAFGSRAQRLEAVFGDLLPVELYQRSSKASFNRAFFGARARDVARRWLGEGIDPAIVDVGALRTVWEEDVPDGRSYLLLQSIWLERATSERLREATPGATSSPPRATTSHEGAEARTQAEPKV